MSTDNSTPAATANPNSSPSSSLTRTSLNGVWVLDRKRGSPSVRGFLETMGVHELAIEANEKGDADHDTVHSITLTPTQYTIKKLSRVNDMVLDVTLGKEHVKALLPGERVKKTLATSEGLDHVRVESTMPTMNGVARVVDVKTLIQEDPQNQDACQGNNNQQQQSSVYVQKLTIFNESTKKSHETTRYFVPFHGEVGPTALTAGGNKRKEDDAIMSP